MLFNSNPSRYVFILKPVLLWYDLTRQLRCRSTPTWWRGTSSSNGIGRRTLPSLSHFEWMSSASTYTGRINIARQVILCHPSYWVLVVTCSLIEQTHHQTTHSDTSCGLNLSVLLISLSIHQVDYLEISGIRDTRTGKCSLSLLLLIVSLIDKWWGSHCHTLL